MRLYCTVLQHLLLMQRVKGNLQIKLQKERNRSLKAIIKKQLTKCKPFTRSDLISFLVFEKFDKLVLMLMKVGCFPCGGGRWE